MTTTVIYICDRCKQEAKSRHDNGGYPPLWMVSILCEPIDHRSQYHSPNKYQTAELCPACVAALGIMKPLLRAETDPPAPTLDDMIRAIVREEQQSGE